MWTHNCAARFDRSIAAQPCLCVGGGSKAEDRAGSQARVIIVTMAPRCGPCLEPWNLLLPETTQIEEPEDLAV
jgi:hypothetical protein